MPVITVVTVVYNDANHIENTIKGVISQTYKNIEYIIIDGGSSDSTPSIISKYANNVTHWVSEKDAGIFDAMNKGIKLATGEWIIFINSGDTFYDSETLEHLNEYLLPNYQLIYGNVEVRYDGGGSYIKIASGLDKLKFGMPFCHQSLIVKAELMKKYGYSLDSGAAADYDFIVKCRLSGYNFYNSDMVIASVSAGGVSDKNRVLVLSEWKKVSHNLDSGVMLRLYYGATILIERIKIIAKFFLPEKIILWIINFRRLLRDK